MSELRALYTPGDNGALTVGGITMLTRLEPDDELLAELLDVLLEATSVDEAVELVVERGMRRLKDVALVAPVPGGVRVVLRGAGTALLHGGQRLSATGFLSDQVVTEVEVLTLSVGDDAVERPMPFLQGVVAATALVVVLAAQPMTWSEVRAVVGGASGAPATAPLAAETSGATADSGTSSTLQGTVASRGDDTDAVDADAEHALDHLFAPPGAESPIAPSSPVPPPGDVPEIPPPVPVSTTLVAEETLQPSDVSDLVGPVGPVEPSESEIYRTAGGSLITSTPWSSGVRATTPAPATPTPAPQAPPPTPAAPPRAPAVTTPAPAAPQPVQPPTTSSLPSAPPPHAGAGGSAVDDRTRRRSDLLSAAPDAPLVWAARCPGGHLSAAYAQLCRVCGAAIPEQATIEVPRPPLGRLILPDGQAFQLDRGAFLGRNPEVPVAYEGRPHLVRLPDPQSVMSRQHAELKLDMWNVLLVDLSSTNETSVTLPGRPSERLRPHEPYLLQPGSVITIAETVSIRFEATG